MCQCWVIELFSLWNATIWQKYFVDCKLILSSIPINWKKKDVCTEMRDRTFFFKRVVGPFPKWQYSKKAPKKLISKYFKMSRFSILVKQIFCTSYCQPTNLTQNLKSSKKIMLLKIVQPFPPQKKMHHP